MTEDFPPLPFRWDGEAFWPLQPRRADRFLTVGEVYSLAPYSDRSQASHGHQFAWLREAWQNLPEALADLYPSPEHLRKRALIDAGYYDETAVDCGSEDVAERVAVMMAKADDFALIFVRGCVVVRRVAKSQSRRAMGKEEFQASKSALMEIIGELIGVKLGETCHG